MIVKYPHTIENILDGVRVIVYVDYERRVTHDFPNTVRDLDRLIETITTEELDDDGMALEELYA